MKRFDSAFLDTLAVSYRQAERQKNTHIMRQVLAVCREIGVIGSREKNKINSFGNKNIDKTRATCYNISGWGSSLSRADDSGDDGRWVTTENDHKIHFNGEGVPDKGNPYVIRAIQVGNTGRIKAHWEKGFPKVTVHTNLIALRHKHPELHSAAKHGDYDAAEKLVDMCVKDDVVREFAEKYKDAIVVPVMAQNKNGANQIPFAFAQRLAEAGMKINDGIVQIRKAKHTDADKMHRLLSRAGFSGKVEKGKSYVLLDDHVTDGGTFNDLRKYIETNGGKVVAATALSASRGGTYLAIQDKTADAIYDKYGDSIDSVLKDAGIAGDVRSLTDKQGRYILSFNPENFYKKLRERM